MKRLEGVAAEGVEGTEGCFETVRGEFLCGAGDNMPVGAFVGLMGVFCPCPGLAVSVLPRTMPRVGEAGGDELVPAGRANEPEEILMSLLMPLSDVSVRTSAAAEINDTPKYGSASLPIFSTPSIGVVEA